MVLKDEYFAVKKINWQDKVQNIIEIAEELNIGLDSLVFLDDNPVERTRVRTSLPDVLVPDLPENPHDYLDTLRNLNDFNTLALTDEDLNRGEMYVARGKRKSLASNIQSIDDFIQSLEITAHIKKITDYSLPRVASLVNRTNQFNATTRRYTEHEIQTLSTSGEMDIYTLQVEDKFGDEGIVGVAMVKKENNELFIDNFLMSCRVIGRKIETAFLIHIINSGTKAGFKTLHAEYIPTKKNKLVEELFDKHNFEIISRENGTKKYRHNLNKVMEFPEFLTIKSDA
jgi:FkbH-like protein